MPTNLRFPHRSALAAWALLAAAATAAASCRSPEPRQGDPLADEEYARSSPSRDPSGPAFPPADEVQVKPGRTGRVAIKEHRAFQCHDAGTWYRDGQKYRQGCLQCQCAADRSRSRIDCRELRGCKPR